MEEIGAFIMITAVSAIIAFILVAFMNFLLKWKVLSSGQVDEQSLELIKKQSDKYLMLRWGILLLFGGLGLMVLQFVPYYADQSPLPWGIEAIFLAIGFLVYYAIVKKEK
jgi:hypothetical protein